MYMVDYKNNEQQKETTSTNLTTVDKVLKFILERSLKQEGFTVLRINKYENGELVPHTITYENRFNLIKL